MSDSSNLKIFSEQLEKFRKKTHERMDRAKQDLARKTLAKLCARSPVLTGQYVLSHHVSLNIPATTSAPPHILPAKGRQSVIMTARNKGQQVIMTAGYNDTIFITNNCPHARFVEYLGWKTKSAYHPYGLTKLEMRLIAKQIVKAYENKKI